MAQIYNSITVSASPFPAKTLTSNFLNLRTSCVKLRGPPSSFVSAITVPPKTFLLIPVRATPVQKYVYPDPIPEFAIAETRKFRAELLKKLSNERETFGDELNSVIDICAEIFSEFLHKQYGGPGTLVVEPFTDMFVALKEKKLPGAPMTARASLLWAQNYVDTDWEMWNSTSEDS